MPVFQYVVLNGKTTPELIEIEQAIGDKALDQHPVTGEPIKRVMHSPSLTLKHSSGQESKILSHDNLVKNGFSIFEKDSSADSYTQTVGQSKAKKDL